MAPLPPPLKLPLPRPSWWRIVGSRPASVAGTLASSADGGRLNLAAALGASAVEADDPVKDDSGTVDENPVYVVGATIGTTTSARTTTATATRPHRATRMAATGSTATCNETTRLYYEGDATVQRAVAHWICAGYR